MEKSDRHRKMRCPNFEPEAKRLVLRTGGYESSYKVAIAYFNATSTLCLILDLRKVLKGVPLS